MYIIVVTYEDTRPALYTYDNKAIAKHMYELLKFRYGKRVNAYYVQKSGVVEQLNKI